jgi:hypothetical protein
MSPSPALPSRPVSGVICGLLNYALSTSDYRPKGSNDVMTHELERV